MTAIVPESSCATFIIEGRLDADGAKRLRSDTDQVPASRSRHVVVDISRVTFLDSCGLAALVGVRKTARTRGASFTVVCAPGRIRNLLELTGMGDVLHLTDPEAFALSGKQATAGAFAGAF